jgi:tRNA nucleotidyltransferase/poly(A) polymerase
VYEVGGSIRNELLRLPSNDTDYAVEAPSYDALIEWLKENQYEIIYERKEFGSVKVRQPSKSQNLKHTLDFTLCRSDGKYVDHRHPESVTFGTLQMDVKRRDFTMNALARDVQTKQIIDLVGGMDDIKTRLIRCVGKAQDRFEEDPLRMLRAIRFHITLEMKLHDDIVPFLDNAMFIDKLFASVSIERIQSECAKCFTSHAFRTILFLSRHEYLLQKIVETLDVKLCRKI